MSLKNVFSKELLKKIDLRDYTLVLTIDELMDSGYKADNLTIVENNENLDLIKEPSYVYGREDWIVLTTLEEQHFVSYDTLVEVELEVSEEEALLLEKELQDVIEPGAND